MKNANTILILVLSLLVFSCEKPEADNNNLEGINFKSSAKAKKKSLKVKLITKMADFTKREGHTSVAHNNKIWVIGGFDGGGIKGVPNNEVWHSKDGVSWILSMATKHFSPRTSHTSTIFKNRIWVIGGNQVPGRTNDVWHSKDGSFWQKATENAGFSKRSSHTSFVFKNRLWVIGGLDQNNNPKNDVWYSKNGVDWIQATSNAAFSPRFDHTSFIYNGVMWVIGGIDGIGLSNKITVKNDVWYSKNGVDWIQATSDAAFLPRKSHTSVVYKNKMWVLGGSDIKANKIGDAWCSENGVTWKPILENEFLKRAAHTTTVFDKKIWGIAGTNGAIKNDIWVLK